jgi:hypothetical protein
VCVGAAPTAFGSPRAAENQFRAPAWTGHRLPKFANFVNLSAGRRACEPAAKPAIPGVIYSTMCFFGMSGICGLQATGLGPGPLRRSTRFWGWPAAQKAESGSGTSPQPAWGSALCPSQLIVGHRPPNFLGLRRSTHFGLACGAEGRKQSKRIGG